MPCECRKMLLQRSISESSCWEQNETIVWAISYDLMVCLGDRRTVLCLVPHWAGRTRVCFEGGFCLEPQHSRELALVRSSLTPTQCPAPLHGLLSLSKGCLHQGGVEGCEPTDCLGTLASRSARADQHRLLSDCFPFLHRATGADTQFLTEKRK